MKDRPHATEEAIARVRSQGEEAIFAFIDEVPQNVYLKLAEYLPNVPGFRKNSTVGIQKQKHTLAKRLASKGANDRDHRALYAVWRAWAAARLGDANRINKALDRMESAAALNAKPSDDGRLGVEAPIIALFAELRQMSSENVCSREAIRRFFDFSPFSLSQAVAELINESKAALDIEREATITELPKRLRKDEEDINALRARIDALSKQMAAGSVDAATTPSKVSQLRKDLTALGETIAQMSESLKRALIDLKANQQETSAIARDVEQLKGRIKKLTSAAAPSSLPTEQIAKVEAEIRRLSEGLASLASELSAPPTPLPIDDINGRLSSLAEQVAEIEQSRALSTELTRYRTRLETIEAAVKEAANSFISKPQPDYHVPTKNGHEHTGGLHAFRVTPRDAPAPLRLSDLPTTLDAVTEALQRIGLKKSVSQIFAGEIVAALSSRQVVFLKGSLGATVARACTNALSAHRAWSISVPVGLANGSFLRLAMEQVLDLPSPEAASIILEGINRTTLDVTRDALTVSSKAFCFATILEGLASLPVEVSYLEYGPVFDVDCLEWRSRTELDASTVYGQISMEAGTIIRRGLLNTAVNADEPLKLVRQFILKRNVRVERTIVAGFTALSHVKQSSTPVSALQSLSYGWLVPLWLALGISSEEADAELDGGKLDREASDPRIAELLKHGGFSGRNKGDRT